MIDEQLINPAHVIDHLKMVLLDWFYEADGIADEMTWGENEQNCARYADLVALGIKPYDSEWRDEWRKWKASQSTEGTPT